MDNMIIGGVRIYFPHQEEILPAPPEDMPNLAIKATIEDRYCVLGFFSGKWIVLSLPEYESSGKAIMAAVRHGKHN